jgi:heterotetrameric sarcosine oxidase gamma subunit
MVDGNVAVEQCEPRAMLLLLGDAAAVAKALPENVGIPLHPNTGVRTHGLGTCLWLSPARRLLLLAAESEALVAVARIRALSAPDAWAFDAGARYVEFAAAGQDAAAVLNAACSLDLREAAFPVATCAQTRFDQVPVLLFRPSPERFEIFVERPLAHHLGLWLCRAVNDLRRVKHDTTPHEKR